jgi:hypothetical protein
MRGYVENRRGRPPGEHSVYPLGPEQNRRQRDSDPNLERSSVPGEVLVVWRPGSDPVVERARIDDCPYAGHEEETAPTPVATRPIMVCIATYTRADRYPTRHRSIR